MTSHWFESESSPSANIMFYHGFTGPPWIYWPQLVKQLCKKKKHFGVGWVSNSVPGAPYCLSTLPYHPPPGVGFLHKNPSGLIDFRPND